jgi:hypothetical protein
MRWFTPKLRSSLFGLLGHSTQPSDSMLDTGMEDIREAMLELLGELGPQRFPNVTRRIRYAGDVQGLWYLRGDLMAVLADLHGEAVARERLEAVTELFQGLVPGSMTSRPAPLR